MKRILDLFIWIDYELDRLSLFWFGRLGPKLLLPLLFEFSEFGFEFELRCCLPLTCLIGWVDFGVGSTIFSIGNLNPTNFLYQRRKGFHLGNKEIASPLAPALPVLPTVNVIFRNIRSSKLTTCGNKEYPNLAAISVATRVEVPSLKPANAFLCSLPWWILLFILPHGFSQFIGTLFGTGKTKICCQFPFSK
jgi:hypothetical protein